MIFDDRIHAGKALAEALASFRGQPDTIVLGLPRGGVPVAAEVATHLKLPLDLLIVRKLGAPSQPELAIGAIAGNGAMVLNQRIVNDAGLTPEEIEAIATRERLEIERREQAYRNGLPPLPLEGRTVILVDDGLATGASMRAAALAVRPVARRVIIAVPVAPASTLRELSSVSDDIVCLSTPYPFEAVGLFYRNFTQTTDDEVRNLLAAARAQAPPSTNS